MIPNHIFFSDFGKVLFSGVDIVCGYAIYLIFQFLNVNQRKAIQFSCFWFLNPFVIIISTRGSADTIVCFLVVITLFYLLQEKVCFGAFFFGLSIHFKIYPIIYSLLFIFYCMDLDRKRKTRWYSYSMEFVVISCSTFFLCTFFFYYIYGYTYLFESFLYHASRIDIHHNYSIFFYLLYLQSSIQSIHSLWMWIPHLILFPLISYLYHNNLCLGIFLLSFLFVTFNKVITAQYFLWWIVPFIFIIPTVSLSCFYWLLVTFVIQMIWNAIAYLLEFYGYSMFLPLWIICILYFFSNCIFAFDIIRKCKVYPKGIKKD